MCALSAACRRSCVSGLREQPEAVAWKRRQRVTQSRTPLQASLALLRELGAVRWATDALGEREALGADNDAGGGCRIQCCRNRRRRSRVGGDVGQAFGNSRRCEIELFIRRSAHRTRSGAAAAAWRKHRRTAPTSKHSCALPRPTALADPAPGPEETQAIRTAS